MPHILDILSGYVTLLNIVTTMTAKIPDCVLGVIVTRHIYYKL